MGGLSAGTNTEGSGSHTRGPTAINAIRGTEENMDGADYGQTKKVPGEMGNDR